MAASLNFYANKFPLPASTPKKPPASHFWSVRTVVILVIARESMFTPDTGINFAYGSFFPCATAGVLSKNEVDNNFSSRSYYSVPSMRIVAPSRE